METHIFLRTFFRLKTKLYINIQSQEDVQKNIK